MAGNKHIPAAFHPNPRSDTLPHLNHNDYLDKIPLVTPKEVAEEIRSNLN
jgi:hypothetical protein